MAPNHDPEDIVGTEGEAPTFDTTLDTAITKDKSLQQRGRTAADTQLEEAAIQARIHAAIKENEEYRKRLFKYAVRLVGVCTLISTLTLAASFIWTDKANTAIVTAYFTSITVQIIGILTVVARSVFPANHLEQLIKAGDIDLKTPVKPNP